jgi:hypothetical protein
MNFAGVYGSPVVFLCQNNQWAISCPSEKQTASESYAVKGEAYGIPGVRVDGNDVLAVYDAVAQAVARARAGEGPTLVEAVTFRMGGHSTSDDPTRYIEASVFKEWEKKDPLTRFRAWLEAEGHLAAGGADAMVKEIRSRDARRRGRRRGEEAPRPGQHLQRRLRRAAAAPRGPAGGLRSTPCHARRGAWTRRESFRCEPERIERQSGRRASAHHGAGRQRRAAHRDEGRPRGCWCSARTSGRREGCSSPPTD